MATSKERQIERDKVAEENGKKLDKILKILEDSKSSTAKPKGKQ